MPQPRDLANNVQLALIGSRPRAFQRALDEPCTLLLSLPKNDTKRDFAFLIWKNSTSVEKRSLLQSFFLQKKFQRQMCNYIIPLSNGPQMDCGRRPYLPKILRSK